VSETDIAKTSFNYFLSICYSLSLRIQ